MTAQAQRTPLQTKYIADTLARMKREILRDIALGIVPEAPESFGTLHDHVDANCYGGMCDDSDSEATEGRVLRGLDLIAFLFPDPEGSENFGTLNSQAGMDVCAELQAACDEWIRAGMPSEETALLRELRAEVQDWKEALGGEREGFDELCDRVDAVVDPLPRLSTFDGLIETMVDNGWEQVWPADVIVHKEEGHTFADWKAAIAACIEIGSGT